MGMCVDIGEVGLRLGGGCGELGVGFDGAGGGDWEMVVIREEGEEGDMGMVRGGRSTVGLGRWERRCRRRGLGSGRIRARGGSHWGSRAWKVELGWGGSLG